MGKSVWRSVEYFFTGNYVADDDDNTINAIGFGGVIHAYGGNDQITVGSIGATVYTGTGDDIVNAGAAYLKVFDDSGALTVRGAAGYVAIEKTQSGNIDFSGLSGAVSILHFGHSGDINYQGAALANWLARRGFSGNVFFSGAGGYNQISHHTDNGDLRFNGAGAANQLERRWFQRYQGSSGDIFFTGAGAANIITSSVESGRVNLHGAGAYNRVLRQGREGDIDFRGVGGWNELFRLCYEEDDFHRTRGDIHFSGAGGYNRIVSDVANGNIHFQGVGGFNHITRRGADAGNPLDSVGAESIRLISGKWGDQERQVSAIKSTVNLNTYIFAIYEHGFTKVNQIELLNDPDSGKLRYFSTSWYRTGDHLNQLSDMHIGEQTGFTPTKRNGVGWAYKLTGLTYEHQKAVQVRAVESEVKKDQWISYGGGLKQAVNSIEIVSAKIGSVGGGYVDGGVTVDAVRSAAQPSCYIFARYESNYTKVVKLELVNDAVTGEVRYRTSAWRKTGNHIASIAEEIIGESNGYSALNQGEYEISDLHYRINTVTALSGSLSQVQNYSVNDFAERPRRVGNTEGNIIFEGAGGGNLIESDVTQGDIHFSGAGAANVVIKKGQLGDLVFRGAGLANVLLHLGAQGRMDVYAAGAANVLIRRGDGSYLARLLAYGNISVHHGNGDGQVLMLGGFNSHTHIGSGRGRWMAAGGLNVFTKVGSGAVDAVMAGGGNVLSVLGGGDLAAGLLGGANVVSHIHLGNGEADTRVVALGGANVLTKHGDGKLQAMLGGQLNVLTHIGQGETQAIMLGAANVLTKVGDGDLSAVMLAWGNVLSHVGDGRTLGVMAAAGNIFTKVGGGTSIAAMVGAGNVFTHIGQGDAWALMGGVLNVFTKVGDGKALALMIAKGNIFTHVGNGLTVALMLAKGNVATKVGDGMTLAAMIGGANVFSQIGHGETFAAMIGKANVLTKVGDGLTAALMAGKANVFTQVGHGISLGLFAGDFNLMTKVGDGATLAAAFGKANVMTHVGSGITGVLALGKANIVTKVGDGLLGVLAKAEANVVTHVGNGVTAALLLGKGNVLTKVGNGATVGLLVSDVGNVLTQVGDGLQIGFAKGKANLMTKVGAGDQIVAAWGELNVLTHVGDGLGVRAAKGRANVLSKIGQGGQLSIVQGEANVVTHIGDGDDYVGAWGRANVVTKVGAGRQVTLAKGEANIITQVGQGDGYQALLGRANLVTKVGDGIQVTAAKGEANVVTTVGDGLSVTAVYGKLNSNIKVGSGASVNVAWGDYNLNTQWGDGLNVAVMKGKGNANIQIGDGLMISAAYARNNVVVKVGNGDFYSLAVASSNTASNKLAELFGNIKQTLLGAGASQAINYLVQGDEGETSGVSRQGRGGFRLPGRQSRTGAEEESLGVELTEVQQLQGFRLDEIGQTDSSLASDLRGQVSRPQDVDEAQHASRLSIDEQGAEQTNLIVNGDFEQEGHGWQSTHGIEAWLGAGVYGLSAEAKYGQFSSELSTDRNTTIYQDLDGLRSGQTITLDFDFARRLHAGLEHGIEVRWNNVLVFSSQGDAAEWQHKQLQLAAVTGRNRISFSGTGPENSLGYVIDNVAAYAESMPDLNVPSAGAQASQDQAAAERDQQRLEQEKERQLADIEGSLRQLEASDEQQLSRNGDWLRDVLSEEAEAVTSRLGQLTRGLESFAAQRQEGGSGHAWRDRFAGELPKDVQEQLARAQTAASDALNSVDQQHQRQQAERQAALQKSERGRRRSEEARLLGQDQTQAAAAQGEAQASQAQSRQQQAQARQEQANQDVEQARHRGAQSAEESRQKVSQAASDAKSVQQQGDAKPERVVRSAAVVEPQRADAAERDETTEAGEVDEFDGEAGGTENPGQIAPELGGLADARAAVNRLQINAGLRARSRSYLGKAQPVRQAPASRDEGGVAGDLEGLGKDGDAGDVPADQVLQRQVSTIRDQMEPGSQAIKELRIGVSFRTDGNGKAHIEHDLKAIESLNQLKNKNGDPLFPFKIVPVTLPVGARGPVTPSRDAAWTDLDNINLLYIPGAPTASDIQVGSSSPSSPSHQEELNLNRPVRPEPPSMPKEPIAPEPLASKKQQNAYKSQLAQYQKQLAQYQRQLAQYETQVAKYERINGEHQSRSTYELRLLEIARARGIPIIAVCAGSWRLLELYGGEVRTLRRSSSRDQHKASNPAETWQLEHELRLMDGKVISQLMETQEGGDSKITGINSTHWAVPTYDDTPEGRKLRDGTGTPSRWLSISAEDPNTLTVEAFESRYGVPVMGLQWHPEAYLPGMLGEMSGTEEARALSRAIFEYMVFSAKTAQQRAELVASLNKHFEQREHGDTSKPNRVPDTEELESLGATSGLRSERQESAEEVEKTPLDGLITRQALQQEASVFAKRIGPSYRAILDGLERLPTVGGDTQLAEGLALHQRLSRYLAEHPTSGRNPALGRLRAQLEEKLFAGDMLSRREDLLAVAKESPQLAVRLYQLARETARSGDSELTTAALAWARADSTAALARLNALVDAEPGKTWRADSGELASFADDVRRATGRVVDTVDSDALAPSTETTHAERTRPRPSGASSGRVEFIDRLMQQPDADLERFLLRKNPELKPLCDYVFRDVDLPDGRFGRITSQFVSKQHLLAFSVASNLGNFAVSAREAGALTLERLADGAAAKGHDILEKTVKGSSLSSAYGAEGAQKLVWLQELGLAGLVGHWDPETKALLGFYVTPELYAQRDSADEAERAVGQRVLRVDADHYYFPVDISDFASVRSSTALLRESPQWQQKMYTGDYDLHDMVSFSGRAHSVPSSSQTERFIRDMLNAAVAAKDESRPLRRGSHHTVQHGPQVSYPAHMGAHEQGVPLVGAVANPSFPLALCDRGVWQPIVHDVDQLQGAYRRMGAHLKVTWQPGEDHPRFVPDGENGQVRMVRRPSQDSAEGASADSLNIQGLGGTHERVESSRLDISTELAQWRTEQVTSQTRGETASRFDGQLIFQMENDPVAARAAARLAGKHPGKSVLVQVGADGQYRVVHGELSSLSGKLRLQVVGHGREDGADGNSRLSGYDADSLAARLLHVSHDIARAHGIETQAEHVSLVGCSLVGSSRQDGYARGFFEAMERRGAVASVSARSSEVAVDAQGRKHTRSEQGDWRRKEAERKVVFSRGEDLQLQVRRESIRSGIAEGDINLARVGQSRRASASGAIADNQDVFQAPKKRVATHQEGDASSDSRQLSYSGNINVHLGNGEFTKINWGTSNLGIKVGTGGMKSLVFGDNNVMIHIGDGDSQHSVDIAGYRALEGAQLFIGNRNVSFNLGRSNDLIVMADKSIPMPPLVNPFDDAARIAGVLQTIAGNRDQSQWLSAQWAQWTLAGVEKYLADTAGLDQTSSVDYASLADLDSQHQRSSRGLKSDIEATLNKKFNQWQSSQGQQGGGQLSRADKLRQMNEKLAFNFAVGGQGADIQITTANWNFVFGDNIQSILDTNLGSLFGLLTQQFTATGMAKTTFTFTPTDLPRQLQNRLMGRLAGVGSDTTLGDIFGVDYTAQGGLVSRSGEAIDAPAMLREMLSVIADFGGEQLASFTDPARWLDALGAGADLGKDALRSFARSHGLQAAAPDETDHASPPADALAAAETDHEAFGLNALHLPNLFATLFSQDKQSEMEQLLSNLKQNLSADLLNMQEQTFDFLRNSGHLQGDGDMHVSLGNYNFNWGGDGKDLGAYLGENNNFWGGRGDDVFYATGTSNVFSGGAGSDTGVLMGRENMMFGGEGDDVAVLAGRINHAYLGDGNDQAYVFGEGGVIDGGAGQDYLVVSGNYNSMDGGAGQDFVVAIGNHNQISLGQGNDYAVVFGNHNRLQADHGRNQIKLMGYHALVTGADEGDHLIADSASKFSEFSAGAGDDVLVLGGYQNRFSGGEGVNSFVLSEAVIDCEVLDVEQDDYIVLDDIDQQDIWFRRNGDDLQILLNRCDETAEASDQDRFEQIGAATFNGYFSNKRAQIVLELGDIQKNSLRSYTALSHQAVDALVQAMSGFAPEAGQAGFISNIDRASSQAVQAAWSMAVQGDGKLIV